MTNFTRGVVGVVCLMLVSWCLALLVGVPDILVQYFCSAGILHYAVLFCTCTAVPLQAAVCLQHMLGICSPAVLLRLTTVGAARLLLWNDAE